MTARPFLGLGALRIVLATALPAVCLLAWGGSLQGADLKPALTVAPRDAADTEKIVDGLASPSLDRRMAVLRTISASGDPALLAVLDAYRLGQLGRYQGHLVVVTQTYQDDDFNSFSKLAHPVSGELYPKEVPSERVDTLTPSPPEYGLLSISRALGGLANPDPTRRLESAETLYQAGDLTTIPILEGRLVLEKDSKVRRALTEGAALLRVRSAEKIPSGETLVAVHVLGHTAMEDALPALDALASGPKSALASAAAEAAKSVRAHARLGRLAEYLFSGLSLSSILVLMALGLSVIFGLMGVINMAHGELMMIGAFTAYVMEHAFERWASPSWFNWYFVLAVPASFLVAGAVGWLIEQFVVRHLYGRPLETLLATWGVSLILIQAVRTIFGDSVAVNSPSWFQGGLEFAQGVVLSSGRCFIIALAAVSVGALYFVMGKTRMGLLIRATTQNRGMAQALGVNVRKVDAATFAFGAGLAGVAGCALTLVNGISPDMGQNYVVDSFLVVVTGGVGKLAGAVVAGLGLGTFTKMLEPFTQATWANIWMLILVVVLIHWRPSGLFPAKGRIADADR